MLDIFANPDPNFVFWLMLLHCLIGLSAGIVADTKGYSFAIWLLIGSIGGTLELLQKFFVIRLKVLLFSFKLI